MSSRTSALMALAGANILYGINYTIAKIPLAGYIAPFGFILIRVSLALIFFSMLYLFFVKGQILKKDYPRLILCGLFGVAINQLCFFKGLQITTEINASLIMITTPILVLIISHWLLHERITGRKLVGITCGAIGAALLITTGGNFSFGSETWQGDIFIFINAASYAIYLVLVKPLMKKYPPLMVITWVFLFGWPFVMMMGLPELLNTDFSTFTTGVWLSVIYVVVGVTILAYLLNIYALGKVNPSVVSVFIYAQPLIAAVVAISLGNDGFTLAKLVAGLFIFSGVFLVSRIRLINFKGEL